MLSHATYTMKTRNDLVRLLSKFTADDRNVVRQPLDLPEARSVRRRFMKSVRLILNTLSLSVFHLALLGILSISSTAQADNAAGVKAYKAKQYQLAYKEFYADALKGNENSAFNLGYMYQHGVGLKVDHVQAAKWLKISADLGDVDAMIELGLIYEDGELPGDPNAQALPWYRKAAAKGNSDGQYKVGLFYDYGFGVKQDYPQAFKWFRQAIAQGNQHAEYEMGFSYDRGNGIKQDYAQAAVLYRKAALQGNVKAQASLGQLYEEGQGVPKNRTLALQWCQKAADAGDDNGIDCVTRLKP